MYSTAINVYSVYRIKNVIEKIAINKYFKQYWYFTLMKMHEKFRKYTIVIWVQIKYTLTFP
jgi:hypothetical protein